MIQDHKHIGLKNNQPKGLSFGHVALICLFLAGVMAAFVSTGLLFQGVSFGNF